MSKTQKSKSNATTVKRSGGGKRVHSAAGRTLRSRTASRSGSYSVIATKSVSGTALVSGSSTSSSLDYSSVPLKQLRADLTAILEDIRRHGTRCILTRNGKPIAALLDVEDLQFLEEIENNHDLAIIAENEGDESVPFDPAAIEHMASQLETDASLPDNEITESFREDPQSASARARVISRVLEEGISEAELEKLLALRAEHQNR